jgi:uncharacterized iron-regulated membrane protein
LIRVKIHWPRFNRKVHYWAAILCAFPVLVVILSGILLLLKKESDWIQPPTREGVAGDPTIPFAEILARSKGVEEAEIRSWADVTRLDVRPDKGVIKVNAANHWEIQIDHRSGEILQVAYRRSDLIESIHDGSFFHDSVKLWIFLPSAIVLLVLWFTGIYLFAKPLLVKWQRKRTVKSSP